MADRVQWRGPQVKAALAAEMGKRMVEVEKFVRGQYQQNVGLPYPPASRPGEFPHVRSGRLFRGVTSNVNVLGDGKTIRLTLGNTASSERGFPYPAALEHGTSRMAPRPHLSATLFQVLGVIKTILGAR